MCVCVCVHTRTHTHSFECISVYISFYAYVVLFWRKYFARLMDEKIVSNQKIEPVLWFVSTEHFQKLNSKCFWKFRNVDQYPARLLCVVFSSVTCIPSWDSKITWNFHWESTCAHSKFKCPPFGGGVGVSHDTSVANECMPSLGCSDWFRMAMWPFQSPFLLNSDKGHCIQEMQHFCSCQAVQMSVCYLHTQALQESLGCTKGAKQCLAYVGSSKSQGWAC